MPYEPDFSGAVAKFDRAGVHMAELEAELSRRITEVDAVQLRAEFDPNEREYVIRVDALPIERLRRVGLIIGDAIQNLRSALDHVTYELVRVALDGADPAEPWRIQFPIADHPTGKQGFDKEWKKLGVTNAVWEAAFVSLQPYKTGHGFHLRRLRQINNIDKHRVLTPLQHIALFDPGAWLDLGHVRVIKVIPLITETTPLDEDTAVVRVRVKPVTDFEPERVPKGYATGPVVLANGDDPLPVLDVLRASVREAMSVLSALV